MKDLSKVKKDKDKKGYYIERIAYDSKTKKNYLGKIYGLLKTCSVCNESYFVSNSQIKRGFGQSCSYHCARMGNGNGRWNGGRIKSKAGYIRIYMPKHPHCDPNGYILEHRLVMEKYIGRYLKPEEVVHHRGIRYPIDSIENKQDNRTKNLMLFENTGAHLTFHCLLRKMQIVSSYHKSQKKKQKEMSTSGELKHKLDAID